MAVAPKRRWFRFSLRTLFVAMTLLAAWLGYHFNWIRQRHAALVFEGRAEASMVTPNGPKTVIITSQAPWPLNWMGEPGHTALIVGGRTEPEEVERIRKLFPEADVDALEIGSPEFEAWTIRLLRLNRRVFDLDDVHPAKRFLIAFMRFRGECLEREADPPGLTPIDQQWQSPTDDREWSFSEFTRQYLSGDIELDGFLTSAPDWTESERKSLERLPRYRALMFRMRRTPPGNPATPTAWSLSTRWSAC